MIKDIAIKVENLSKIYKLYNKPIDRMKESLHPLKKKYHKDFYALNKINFEILKGECIGIIGRNGAGKSTLLKIITGVLTPSSGHVTVKGKISSLLELGTGFNPEYNGIENIYFQGNLMGYSKEEMDDKLDAILDFADIGEFIYQPVKNYSTGMYVRLAFACSINVEPEIFIIDEALSVGDARFQLKCFKRLDEIKNAGSTIIFVSHSIEQVKSLCSRGIVIESGGLIFDGNPVDAGIEYYKVLYGSTHREEGGSTNREEGQNELISRNDLDNKQLLNINELHEYYSVDLSHAKTYGQNVLWINWIKIYNLKAGNIFISGSEIIFEISYSWDASAIKEIRLINNLEDNLLFGIRIENSQSIVITDTAASAIDYRMKAEGSGVVLSYKVKFPKLQVGEYFFSPGVALGKQSNLLALSEYVYLFSLVCETDEMILGLQKFDYSITEV